MLTGLNVFSLTCKCVFYRTELNTKGGPIELNFEGLEMNQTKRQRAERVDEKNGVICLVIMFTSRVLAFKMSKMANYFCFILIAAKYQSQLGQYLKVHVEDLIEFLQKMEC